MDSVCYSNKCPACGGIWVDSQDGDGRVLRNEACEPCQVGNEAALSRSFMCRKEAWLFTILGVARIPPQAGHFMDQVSQILANYIST